MLNLNKHRECRLPYLPSSDIGIISIILFSIILTSALVAGDVNTESQSAFSKSDALKIAQEYFGLNLYNIDTLDANEIDSIVGTRIGLYFDLSYLGKPYENKLLYEIPFNDIDLRINKVIVEYGNLQTKDFIALIDPISGKLLQIFSINEYEESEWRFEVTCHPSNMRGLPDSLPKITFYEAILAARHCKPIYCKGINAIYINYSFYQGEVMPVWYITCLWGKPEATGPKYESVPDYMKCNYSCIVDTLGKCRQLHTAQVTVRSKKK